MANHGECSAMASDLRFYLLVTYGRHTLRHMAEPMAEPMADTHSAIPSAIANRVKSHMLDTGVDHLERAIHRQTLTWEVGETPGWDTDRGFRLCTKG
jgi:hypothetical protein